MPIRINSSLNIKLSARQCTYFMFRPDQSFLKSIREFLKKYGQEFLPVFENASLSLIEVSHPS
jgi:hypothetical protein